MRDLETASSTLEATIAPRDASGSAREAVRFQTIKGGYPDFERCFCKLVAIARPIFINISRSSMVHTHVAEAQLPRIH